MTVELFGYRHSVYVRIARLALEEKQVRYVLTEVDPFAEQIPEQYLAMHPFRRVPTLVHDGFVLYETGAITRYVDEAFDGPSLQPETTKQRARMQQIVSVVDSYGYWPMVRQVFAHRVFRPRVGQNADESEVARGLAGSANVLRALEKIAGAGTCLVGDQFTLADVHLAPMMSYFTAAPEAATLLGNYRRLSEWWERVACRPTMLATEPGLP